ncbi:MAG: ABC transporter ATP-binding protein [Xenococcaceae cyanobacterium MO_167.B27]|nr:ABC transporter ATP-binding protein [Xenococcaceae cyanobacterium MO_167.B27]
MISKKFFLKIALERPWFIVGTLVFNWSGAIFNGLGAAILIPFLVVLFGADQDNIIPPDQPILKRLFSLFDGFEGEQKILVMLSSIVLVIFLKNVTNYCGGLLASYYTKYLVKRIKLEGMKILLEVSMEFYTKNKLGDILATINREVNRSAASIKGVITMFITCINILTFIYFLLLLSWQLTIVTTLLLGFVSILNQYIIKKSKEFGRRLSEQSRQYSRKMLEILTGIRLIKLVANEDKEYKSITELIEKNEKVQLQSQEITSLVGPINEMSGIITIIALVFICRYLFSTNIQEFAPILLTYLLVLFRLLPLIGKLNTSRTQLANTLVSVNIILDFLDRKNKLFLNSGTLELKKITEGVTFNQVSFSYPNSKDLVLQNINLEIPKGKTVALVGASGAGKSTIADLVPRFYDPIKGEILIDGIDLRDYDIKSVRKAMGVVSQDTFSFNNSVRYNISYGLENVAEESLIEATKRANAYEFIIKLPQGFDTNIGERGVMLSGGQRQRIAIARALLRNPDILILDEATSALDTVSEKLVQQAIDELCTNRTTLVIAHRLSTIQQADMIVVLDRGKIVEQGSHPELLNKGGYYTRLYNMQFSNQESTNNQETIKNLSYQIRNNLNSLTCSLELISESIIEDREEQTQLIDDSYESTKRIVEILQEYESASKI